MQGLSRNSLDEAISSNEREHREESATKSLLKRTQKQVGELEAKLDLVTSIDAIQVRQPDWAQPPKTRKQRRAVANLMLSDLHLDEVVDLGEMRGKNKYNREIALKRLRATSANTIKMARDYISGVTYDGLYLWMNGDIFSGNIHDELARTNDGVHILDSIDFWIDPLAAAITQLADFFQKVQIVVSYGNHGRSYQKPPNKGSVRSSYDWLSARILWRELRGDDRITWLIPESRDVRAEVYNHRYLMLHGDDFRGGDQIAGAVRPVMMGDYRTIMVEVFDGEPYDTMLVGHFHQYHSLPRAIINGACVGYNEYAKSRKFRPEPPQQAFWLNTPEHGRSFSLPILPMDRSKEGW